MKWIKWALGEAGFRTASMALQKQIGTVAGNLPLVTFSTLIIGVVQAVVAGSVLMKKEIDFFPSGKLVSGSILFGIGAFINTIIAFMAYVNGANIAVYTLITLLAIVPGAIIDKLCFGEKSSPRQIIGIMIVVFAGWLILKAPDISALSELPLWAWLGILNAFCLSINQGITRWVKEVDPWVKNFWGGSTTALLCIVTLGVFGPTISELLAMPSFQSVFAWSGVIALVVIGIWSFNVIAYRDGAAIPVKNVVVNGTFLSLTILVGLLFFDDTISLIQIAGILTYLIAFSIINNETWLFMYVKLKHN